MMSTIHLYNFNKTVNSGKLAVVLIGMVVLITGCSERAVIRKEARDDEKEYKRAMLAQKEIEQVIYATVETHPVTTSLVEDDAADDPAIWYNQLNPQESVIYGSNKKGGIHSYRLTGEEIQFVPCGNINNIDIRQKIRLGDRTVDVLAGSNRSDNSLVFFLIDLDGQINNDPDYKILLSEFEPYGFCLSLDSDQRLHAFVNDKSGRVDQYEVQIDLNLEFSHKLKHQIKLKSQLEGMVVDDRSGTLYVGEEGKGIHAVALTDTGMDYTMMLEGSTEKNKTIRYDIEGLSLISYNNETYLLASSQGNFSYAVFDLSTNSYKTSFVIKADRIDGVEETDGLDVCIQNMGSKFPNGILVVQDGFNTDGQLDVNQNFKVIDMRSIFRLLD